MNLTKEQEEKLREVICEAYGDAQELALDIQHGKVVSHCLACAKADQSIDKCTSKAFDILNEALEAQRK